MDSVKNRLYQAMTIRGMKAVDLAKKVGIDKSSISNYLHGRYKPNAEKIHSFAVALNVSEGWLLGFDVPMERDSEEDKTKKSKTIEEEMSDRFLDHICQIFNACDFEGQIRIYEAVRKIEMERKEKSLHFLWFLLLNCFNPIKKRPLEPSQKPSKSLHLYRRRHQAPFRVFLQFHRVFKASGGHLVFNCC